MGQCREKYCNEKILCLLLVGCLTLAVTTWGQMGGGQPSDRSASLTKFLGKDLSFTATVEYVFVGKKKRDNEKMEMSYAVSEGKVRTEIDLTQSSSLKPDEIEEMKETGMDRMITLFLPETKASYMIYPSLESYCEIKLPPAKADKKEAVVEKTKLGKETIDGRSCIKSKLVVTEANGEKSEAIVWEATDLNNFPIQYQVTEKDGVSTTTFRNIKQGKVDATLFSLPSNYKKYNSVQELMMGNMHRMMGR